MSDELKVEYLLLEEVANKFLEGNSKKHDIGKITDSFQRFGFKLSIPHTLNPQSN